MPIVQISFVRGPTEQQKRDLLGAVTNAVTVSLGVPAEAVVVTLSEVPREAWANGGIPLSDVLPPLDASEQE
jgi:4-oxalocrotonate tautomerase